MTGSFLFRKQAALIVVLALILSALLNKTFTYYVYGDDMSLNAGCACVYDANDNRVLYGKNENKEMAMASTTKIMTLIVLLENCDLNKIATVSEHAASQPEVKLFIKEGERYYMRDLVYSMMLESHNDVAVCLAENCFGSEEQFVAKMNEKAKELGLTHTHFVTVNGLDGEDADGEHKTTAAELAKIAAYAIKNDKFVEITNTKTYSFSEVDNKRTFTVNNKNRYLDMDENAIGIKTGFTSKAGYCFVGALKCDGRCFVSVVLGSGWPPNKNYKWNDTKKLMNYAMKNYNYREIIKSGIEFIIPVNEGVTETVLCKSTDGISTLLSDSDEVAIVYDIKNSIDAPVYLNTKVGEILVIINGILFDTIEVNSCEYVERENYYYQLRRLIGMYLK